MIRSRDGVLRDLIPIYGPYQLMVSLAALTATAALLWLVDWRFPPILGLFLLIGWLSQFAHRPGVMELSESQAEQVGAALRDEGHFTQSEDGGWLPTYDGWPQSRHKRIDIVRSADTIALVGPREWLEGIRAYLEWIEETGVTPIGESEHPFAIRVPEPDSVPWHAHVPSAVLAGVMGLVFISDVVLGRIGYWGVSGAALAQGRFDTILLHMFAHGGAWHIGMNLSALFAVGAPLTMRLGPVPLNWLRFLLLFVLSGLAGAVLYVAFHPFGTVPMVGASGALYGLIALFIRLSHEGEELLSVRSRHIRRIGWELVKQNALLFALLAAMVWMSGGSGGLAWEAHLGGFLFGFFVGPRFLPRARSGPNAMQPASVQAS